MNLASCWPPAARPGRAAFTLVELLIAIAIVALLASAVLFAIRGAQEQGRRARTQAQIAKIHQLLAERWDEYRERPAPVYVSAATDPRTAALQQLRARREMLRMEMPDRATDVSDNPVALSTLPVAARSHRQRVAAVQAASGQVWSPEWEQAECLYLVLASLGDGETTALEFFREQEIGDLDGDGMPEVLDGWGRPIGFLRWAPGFPSDLQNPAQPDPFDPLNVETGTFPLFPLVFSGGPDREYGLLLEEPDASQAPLKYSASINNPYVTLSTGERVGKPLGSAANDNMVNHGLATR